MAETDDDRKVVKLSRTNLRRVARESGKTKKELEWLLLYLKDKGDTTIQYRPLTRAEQKERRNAQASSD